MHTFTSSQKSTPVLTQEADLFFPALDRDFLARFYHQDYEDASFMFNLFLTHTVNTFQDMSAAMEAADTDEVKRLAHKISPTFKAVGLTSMAADLSDIGRTELSQEDLEVRVQSLNNDLDYLLPVVVDQMRRLNTFLSA